MTKHYVTRGGHYGQKVSKSTLTKIEKDQVKRQVEWYDSLSPDALRPISVTLSGGLTVHFGEV